MVGASKVHYVCHITQSFHITDIETDLHTCDSSKSSEYAKAVALGGVTNTDCQDILDQDEQTIEQQVVAGYVEGEHNTFFRDEYDSFDDEMKKKYREAMVQVVVEGID
jgi:hypothetical protein